MSADLKMSSHSERSEESRSDFSSSIAAEAERDSSLRSE
jgi:hypothetical protein